MDADIHTIYESDFYCIRDFKCRCTNCKTSKPEYDDSFGISFVRTGNFLFNIFRGKFDSYTGCILVTKPGYERTVTHIHSIPDECTIFDFKNDFYNAILEQYGKLKFFWDNDWHAALVKTTPETEFLHYNILKNILTKSEGKLCIDSMVMEVIRHAVGSIVEYEPDPKVNLRIKRNHLNTIERAKAYLTENFINDISLREIADHCHVSPFHFSRIFKTFTSCSPHQYLLTLRLKNAETLLHNTSLPVADVAFSSGFNSIEYFTASFRQKYHCPPARFRDVVVSSDKKEQDSLSFAP